jgi:tetratricopeptide (TPR) repeat protein
MQPTVENEKRSGQTDGSVKNGVATMNATIEILRGELERLFSLDEMTSISARLLGLDPQDVGGASAKASFAKALTERCVDGDRLEALVDIILVSRKDVDPRVRDLASLLGKEDLASGQMLGGFTIAKKIGDGDLGIVYSAVRDGRNFTLKVLRREAARDRRCVQRFLTANRLVANLDSPGLPRSIEAGEIQGHPYVAYEQIDAQPLSFRFARTGPLHINELKPVLRGILEPLAALHRGHLVHGDLKLENVLVGKGSGGADAPDATRVVLVDFGSDRLRHRPSSAGHALLAVHGSPKTTAPEILRGRAADAKSDVYAFGAMMYELLSGKPVFVAESATDAAVAHLTKEPEPPSNKAPRGWVTKETDAFILSLLQKDPARRPKDAQALLDNIESLGRASMAMKAAKQIPPEKVEQQIELLLMNPDDSEAAMALEKAVDEGADPTRVAEAFAMAAEGIKGETADEKESKKALLYRAARIFESAAKDKERAEKIYLNITAMDPTDEIAVIALEEVRKALGKYEELVEMLLNRSAAAAPGADKARVLAEIGRLYAHELDDAEQGLVGYTQALCEDPTNEEYGDEIERLAGSNAARWTEALETMTEGSKNEALSQTDRNTLLTRIGRWYEQRLQRADLALMAFQQILSTDPAHEGASEGMCAIYRRAQQWPELTSLLLKRADAAATTPRARDLKVEAAELLESKLNNPNQARDIYSAVVAEDPGHPKASEALARIAERTGDFQTLVKILERRAETRRGPEKAEALVRVAEVYEDHLNDLAQATRRYEAVLALDPTNVDALKGLDRIYNRSGRYQELLEVLERQVAVAATPRQKINLYERMAALYDEEFLDHEKAAACLEQILAIDLVNDAALTGLARHYRALDRWEPLVKLLEKHAASTGDDHRRVELLVQRARTLADHIGSPERAIKAYEQVLERQPGHAGALEALSQLREISGDVHAALSAIEALAMKAQTAEQKAEQWMRAARLLETRGDKDGAIERYKLALDANPKDSAAAVALRKAYAQRGDAASVVGVIERELGFADGDLAKARLCAELARVYHRQLNDIARAETTARRALDLDGSNAEALMVLGDIAYEAGRFLEATKFYEVVVGRTGILSKEDAARVLVQYIEAFGKSSARPSTPPPAESAPGGSAAGPASAGRISIAPPAQTNPKLASAIESLRQVAPNDVQALLRAANVLFEFGDARAAHKMHEDLFAEFGGKLHGSDRAELLYHLGESARRVGDLDAAMKPLQEAADADPANPKPLRSLGKIYEEKGDWEAAIKTRRRRLDVATGSERFDLLLEIGDIEFQKLNDRTRASKTYVAALEERPDDRKLLTKLMQLYSEEKDWGKLVEVVLRLADFVEDKKQRAKYMHTAATIAARHLNETDQALGFYDRALEFDPTLSKARDEAIELHRQKGQHDAVERLLNQQLDQAKEAGDRAKIVSTLDALGELYRKFLNEPELAVDAYEAAQAFDPEDKARAETLAELYASDVTKYLDKAVRAQAQILRRNPYKVESYKLLRKLYTEAKKPDPAWCLCQALSVLNLAEPDEERFYKRHKADNAAPAQAALNEDDWANRVAHDDIDSIVTKIFAMVQPTIIRSRTPTLEQLGYDPRYAIDISLHPYPVSQTLYYVQGVLGIPAPLVFQNPNDPAGLGFLHAQVPSIVLGRAAFESQVPTQSLAFLAGRHMTYFRPGYYVRHLVPTGTGLKAWLFAAIRMSVPQFPVTPDLQGQVSEAMAAMQPDFQGVQKEKLASLVSKLLQAGQAIDLKRWVAGIDFTADRAGFILAHDLNVATEVIRATGEEAASVPVKERMKEIVLYGVSEEYFALREKLQISVDS